MEYTKKQKQAINNVIKTYDIFEEDGKESRLGASTIDIYRQDIIYSLIGYIGFYKINQYQERAKALEKLTSHLIADTVMSIDYQSETGLSLFDKAVLIQSDQIQEALTKRYDIENKERIIQVKQKYKFNKNCML